MTKEEALKVLVKMRTWRHWGRGEQNEKDRPEMPEQKEVDEAFNVCIEILSRYSLTSNLDEAAEDYAWKEELPLFDGERLSLCFKPRVNAFKAGAEWMAEQGYTKEGIARPDDCEIWVNFTDTDINDGDEVIIQIRKKWINHTVSARVKPFINIGHGKAV